MFYSPHRFSVALGLAALLPLFPHFRLLLCWRLRISLLGEIPGIEQPPERFISVDAPSRGETPDVLDQKERERFEQLVLPYLDAAFNLARWLLHGRADAEDVTQEAILRAFRFFPGFQGGDARAWLLQIVRNSCFTWLEKNRPALLMTEFDESLHLSSAANPEAQALAGDDRERLARALESLSPRSREVIVLRELEGCSYKEIAAITSLPMGTVMSTLARARGHLREALARLYAKPLKEKEVPRGL